MYDTIPKRWYCIISLARKSVGESWLPYIVGVALLYNDLHLIYPDSLDIRIETLRLPNHRVMYEHFRVTDLIQKIPRLPFQSLGSITLSRFQSAFSEINSGSIRVKKRLEGKWELRFFTARRVLSGQSDVGSWLDSWEKGSGLKWCVRDSGVGGY
ncbi:uncharacterized protein EAF01_005420 [Botrytis porri]|uniref:uncharacterized protein n=1 Tax=Botrytis porri TaxID=87229 RepID=UPI001901E0D2|nr:uncharacterized protein EAF01_005420 [Botrytis porri]KAF7904898.1 hypothetical protein EAF01_005420 [Botrytis porri]